MRDYIGTSRGLWRRDPEGSHYMHQIRGTAVRLTAER